MYFTFVGLTVLKNGKNLNPKKNENNWSFSRKIEMDNSSNNSILKKTLSEEILKANSYAHLTNKINQIPAYDLADLLESLPDDKRISVWKLITPSLKSEILLEVHGEVEKQLIDVTPPSELISGIKSLQNDEIIDLESRLPKEVVDAVIHAMDDERRFNFLKNARICIRYCRWHDGR